MEKVSEIDTLTLDARKRLSMTAVDSVDGFTDQYLKLTVAGIKVQILGDSIKITSFNKSSGNLTADGNFHEIKYNAKKVSRLKRIFK